MMPRYKFILLDADDTLFDFGRAEDTALTMTLRHNNLPWDEPSKALYRRLNQDLWAQFELGEITKPQLLVTRFSAFLEAVGTVGDGAALNAQYLTHLAESAFLLDGAEALCRRLCQVAQLYIVTNGVSTVQHSHMNLSPIKDCFSGVFVSEDAGYQKPQLGYFDYVFARIPGFDAASALIVGDSLTSDITGGIGAGIDSCWYNPAHLGNPRGIVPTYEIHQLDELDGIVAG